MTLILGAPAPAYDGPERQQRLRQDMVPASIERDMHDAWSAAQRSIDDVAILMRLIELAQTGEHRYSLRTLRNRLAYADSQLWECCCQLWGWYQCLPLEGGWRDLWRERFDGGPNYPADVWEALQAGRVNRFTYPRDHRDYWIEADGRLGSDVDRAQEIVVLKTEYPHFFWTQEDA